MIKINEKCPTCDKPLFETEKYIGWRQLHHCRRCRHYYTALFNQKQGGGLEVAKLIDVTDEVVVEHEQQETSHPQPT